MMTDVTQAPAEFGQLCQTLFGDVIDPDVIWSEVAKLSPGSSDVSTKGGSSTRNKLERASNAVGLTAGLMAVGAAARDPRLAAEGAPKWAKRLHATGAKIPSPISSKGGKAGALLAAGALGTQLLNSGGDVAISGTLAAQGRREKAERRKQSDYALAKGLTPVRKAGTGTLFSLPKGVREAANGLRGHWRGLVADTFGPGSPSGAKAATPKVPGQPTLPGLDTKTVPEPNAWRSAGQNLMGAARSKEGQTGMALGAAGAVGLGAVNRRRQPSGQDYLLGKRDDEVVFRGEFTKFDDAKRQAFGWASIVSKDGMPVVDRQGDYIDIGDLEDAAYRYVHTSRVGGDMHRRNGEQAHKVSDMIESIVFTPEKIAKMGLPENFPQGWWVGYQIHDEDTWQEVRKGGRTGFSIHGRGIRKDHDLDALMGY